MWRSHKEELLDHPLLTTDEIKSLLTDLERIGREPNSGIPLRLRSQATRKKRQIEISSSMEAPIDCAESL
jgi:hypothetical protein